MSRVTGNPCPKCGLPISFTAARRGEEPKEVKHTTVSGQPEECPK